MFYSQFIVPIFYAEYSIASSEPNAQEHSILRTSFISGNLFTEIYISSYSRTSVELLFWAFLWLACWVIYIVPGYYVVSFVCSLFFFFFSLIFVTCSHKYFSTKTVRGNFQNPSSEKNVFFLFHVWLLIFWIIISHIPLYLWRCSFIVFTHQNLIMM